MSGSKTALISTDSPKDDISLFNTPSASDLLLTHGTLSSQKLYHFYLHVLDPMTPWFSPKPRVPQPSSLVPQKTSFQSHVILIPWLHTKDHSGGCMVIKSKYTWPAVVKAITLKSHELSRESHKIETYKDVWNAIECISQLFGMEKWNILKEIVEAMALGTPVPKSWLVKLAGQPKAGLLAALLLGRHQKVLDPCLCRGCQEERERLGCLDVLMGAAGEVGREDIEGDNTLKNKAATIYHRIVLKFYENRGNSSPSNMDPETGKVWNEEGFLRLFNKPDLADLILSVGPEKSGTRYYAHEIIIDSVPQQPREKEE
ncbi:uncharacterized protein DFL_000379 [Arthrobotrys flagrans]|uniref:Uncharacterized protein n=1 Tax=Arthrobotrys flagrans TaxID=97331 RepID=A0A437AEZ3_ARTFL|nr:hypothetical protein DFL_000379 [Arthrobotrys flagrans]